MEKHESAARPTYRDVYDAAEFIAHNILRTNILGWLIWLPLQRAEELTSCLDTAQSSVYEHLALLEQRGLLDYIILSEPGKRAHKRYYLTDIGLHAFSWQSNPPMKAAALVRAYSAGKRDLMSLILHQEVTTTLTQFISRLIGEGRSSGYELLSLQHPSHLTYYEHEHQHTCMLDASFIIRPPDELPRTFGLIIDTSEHYDIYHRQQQEWLRHFLIARHALRWQKQAVPRLLILTIPTRLCAWEKLITQACAQRGESIPQGGLTSLSTLTQNGVYDAIWWSLPSAGNWAERPGEMAFLPSETKCVTLKSLFGRVQEQLHPFPAEEPTQSTTSTRPPPLAPNRQIPLYVYGKNREKATALTASDLWPERVEQLPAAEQTELYALLTLRLGSQDKAIITWLARYPLLSTTELAMLLIPEITARTAYQHISQLIGLGLVATYEWPHGTQRSERIRYLLTESALRFLAGRYSISPLYYLLSPNESKRANEDWPQRGARGLKAQIEHTIGVYRCMAATMQKAHTSTRYSILWWQSASESVRRYKIPFGFTNSQLRPDGEICLVPKDGTSTLLLLEYDRATTGKRGYVKKFSAYRDYAISTRHLPPPILVVTQHMKAAQLIEDTAHLIEPRLKLFVMLEQEVLENGLQRWL